MCPHKIVDNPPHFLVVKAGSIFRCESLNDVIDMQRIYRTIETAIKFFEIPKKLPSATLKYPSTFAINPSAGMPQHSFGGEVLDLPIMLYIP